MNQLSATQYTEVRFPSLLSDGFITAIVVNPPERKLAKHTSVQLLFNGFTPPRNSRVAISSFLVFRGIQSRSCARLKL